LRSRRPPRSRRAPKPGVAGSSPAVPVDERPASRRPCRAAARRSARSRRERAPRSTRSRLSLGRDERPLEVGSALVVLDREPEVDPVAAEGECADIQVSVIGEPPAIVVSVKVRSALLMSPAAEVAVGWSGFFSRTVTTSVRAFAFSDPPGVETCIAAAFGSPPGLLPL
jgi:hypothetical protein